jgi:hypothetical protein
MDFIKRNRCIISGASDLEPLHTFRNFPVFMGCTTKPKNFDVTFDMSWVISKQSGMIQLDKLLPLEILYPESHGAGVVGGLWRKHHKAFAAFLFSFNPENVFEIGGSHGILAKEFGEFKDVPWTILEPNPSPVEGVKAKFVKGFFDSKFKHEENFDTLVHSHVFEHIYDPDLFMKDLATFLMDGKKLVFSIPNMKVMLERKYTNCINFEHTAFLTEEYVEYFLSRYGFKVIKKEYFMDDHSIFYGAVKDSMVSTGVISVSMYDINKKIYTDYLTYHQQIVADLNVMMSEDPGHIYLFGAHVFAQYLLAFGLNESKIVSLLDNDENKQGKRLYGTSLSVKSPVVLRGISKPKVILRAGVYNNEIKEDILTNINPNVVFWE